MKVSITPSKPVGTVKAPPSKSMVHRALICAALTEGCVVENLSFSKDIQATLDCLIKLGATVNVDGNAVELCKLDFFEIKDKIELFCDESGSTLRFLIPLCLLSGKTVKFKGSPRLFERPLGIYEDICKEQNLLFEKDETSLTVCGKLKSGNFKIKGDVSSQFITGLLFALPLLDGISIIEIIGKFESESYVKMTLSILKEFGIRIVYFDNRFIIYGNQKYQKSEYTVEGDCSNAAFLEALNFVGGEVNVKGMPETTLQGDRVFADMFKGLTEGEREFDLSDCPDLAPIMFALASTVGKVTFKGTKRLKLKESDRALAMKQELGKLGVDVNVSEDEVYIASGTLTPPKQPFSSHNDHRIVMAISVLLTLIGGTIEGAEAVAKSYPDFFEVLKSLNIGVEINEA
jgi:3-phosphoshikimate 1-carboxyvinyltransferase